MRISRRYNSALSLGTFKVVLTGGLSGPMEDECFSEAFILSGFRGGGSGGSEAAMVMVLL